VRARAKDYHIEGWRLLIATLLVLDPHEHRLSPVDRREHRLELKPHSGATHTETLIGAIGSSQAISGSGEGTVDLRGAELLRWRYTASCDRASAAAHR
jgi:hypothetical protein